MAVPPVEHIIGLSLAFFVIFFIIGYLRYSDVTPDIAEIIKEIYSKFTGRPFSKAELLKEFPSEQAPKVEKALKLMEKYDLVLKRRDGRYEFKEGFLFMSEEKYDEAKRVLVGDKILYGSYQHLILARPWLILIPVSVVILSAIFFVMAYFDIFGINTIITAHLVDNLSVDLFYLFVAAMTFVVFEAILRFIRTFGEQIYTVVVGEKGGIIFVEHLGGGFTGRISRGQIRDVRVEITPFQRFYSFFAPVPVGNVIVKYTGPKEELEIKEEEEEEEKEEEEKKKRKRAEKVLRSKTSFAKPVVKYRLKGYNHVVFQYMPYPNLLAGIIKGVMLRSLGWRLKHAERIAMWRVARGGGAALMVGKR